ncbi:IS1182 family transposase, partial [Halalkalibacterium halodurans]|uniref:IS1182 family transposase n=2 Tax=Halalkalibacterium halodurans TaxID=86665 RepID=UPI002E2266DF
MSNSIATFIHYNMDQLVLPMDFSDLIPEDHVARVVNDMVEMVDEDLFYAPYKGGGRSAYHPKMMTKIILYAYTQKLYSCRDIAKSLREHLPMMWLAARQTPDFRTINRFRSERMKDIIEPLFTSLIQLLLDQNYITMDNYFLDGTKIEANANRYTFVWKKSVQKYKERLQDKLEELFAHIEETIDSDNQQVENDQGENKRVTSEQLREAVTQVEKQANQAEQALHDEQDPVLKKEKKAEARHWRQLHKKLNTDYLPRLERYEDQLATFGDRNSFSKTDRDATFMRMKEDHMKNGQLKPGYNVQAGTENQFIVGYSIHQRPTDTRCLIPHLRMLEERQLPFPKKLIADAGYGSEPNYLYIAENEWDALIPYHTMRKEESRVYRNDPWKVQNWTYLEHDDTYICPNNRRVTFRYYRKRTDAYGYERDFKIYECEDCTGCPFKTDCTKAKGNRQIHYNPVYEEGKSKMKRALDTEEGAKTYRKRKTEVESVFGHIKGNRSFRRFHLRGLDKVNIEFGLIAIAHNFLKQAKTIRLFQEEINRSSETKSLK